MFVLRSYLQGNNGISLEDAYYASSGMSPMSRYKAHLDKVGPNAKIEFVKQENMRERDAVAYHKYLPHYKPRHVKDKPSNTQSVAQASEVRASAAERRAIYAAIDDMPLPPPESPLAGAHVDYGDLPAPPGILDYGGQDPDGPLPPLPPSTPPL